MLYVISENYREYSLYIRQRGLSNGTQVRYVQDERTFRGRRGDDFFRLGGWSRKPNNHRLVGLMKVADFTEVDWYGEPLQKSNTVKHLMEKLDERRVENLGR